MDSTGHPMKSALILVLGGLGAIALAQPTWAQSISTAHGMEPLAPSRLLTTQPLEIEQRQSQQLTGLDTTTLNSVANSIQGDPAKQNKKGVMPSTPFPADLFHAPSRVLEETHPLEVFQPPAPNRSFGINLNRL
jgi:hypothetical protein